MDGRRHLRLPVLWELVGERYIRTPQDRHQPYIPQSLSCDLCQQLAQVTRTFEYFDRRPSQCTGYLTHLFKKNHRTSEGVCRHSLPKDVRLRYTMRARTGARPATTSTTIFPKEQLMVFLLLKRLMYSQVRGLRTRFLQWTRPFTSSLPLQTLADLGRSKSELVAENALLRHQLIILKRQVKRPACTKADRLLLVLLARVVRPWKQALFIVQPETRLARAAGALPPGLETKVKDCFSFSEGIRRNHRLDQADQGFTPRVFLAHLDVEYLPLVHGTEDGVHLVGAVALGLLLHTVPPNLG